MEVIQVYDLIDQTIFAFAAALIALDIVLDVVDVVDVWILVIKDFLIVDDSVVLCGHVHHGMAW